jgi:phosphohistidine swiveling domain-containing protein
VEDGWLHSHPNVVGVDTTTPLIVGQAATLLDVVGVATRQPMFNDEIEILVNREQD